jgi:hypothetical protein
MDSASDHDIQINMDENLPQKSVVSDSEIDSVPEEFLMRFCCDQCQFSTEKETGLNIHTGKVHAEPQVVNLSKKLKKYKGSYKL